MNNKSRLLSNTVSWARNNDGKRITNQGALAVAWVHWSPGAARGILECVWSLYITVILVICCLMHNWSSILLRQTWSIIWAHLPAYFQPCPHKFFSFYKFVISLCIILMCFFFHIMLVSLVVKPCLSYSFNYVGTILVTAIQVAVLKHLTNLWMTKRSVY